MLENIDTSTAIALIGFFVTIAMQLVGFGKIIGSVNVRSRLSSSTAIARPMCDYPFKMNSTFAIKLV